MGVIQHTSIRNTTQFNTPQRLRYTQPVDFLKQIEKFFNRLPQPVNKIFQVQFILTG